tara:strand:- start:101 stop:778 length:678 start_codon:yes stop_codon:yes gene_type:complete
MNYEHLTLGNDAAWGGWGQCLADAARGPLWVGWQKLGGRTWRWTVLREALAELDQLSQLRSIRVVVEKPPAVYKGAGRHGQHGKRAGNQAVVGYGMGQLIGPILAWGEGHHVLDESMQPHNPESPTRWPYPWEVEVSEWRGWWNLRGIRGGREAYKLAALIQVERLGWAEEHLTQYGWAPGLGMAAQRKLVADGQPCGDVAEAILIAVGAAMRPELGPKGPRVRP